MNLLQKLFHSVSSSGLTNAPLKILIMICFSKYYTLNKDFTLLLSYIIKNKPAEIMTICNLCSNHAARFKLNIDKKCTEKTSLNF
jgi:hypothetical protein